MVTDAQNTIIKEFQNSPKVEAAIFHEGEAASWVQAFWTNHFLRDTTLYDPTSQHSSKYRHPSTGIPFGRGFIIDQEGKIAMPYFGYDPKEEMRKIYDLIAFSTFGKGCASTTTLPTITCPQKPKLGQTFVLDIKGFLPQKSGQMIFGVSNTAWGSIPLPFSLLPLGMGNCSLWVSMDLPLAMVTDTQGSFRLSIPIPLAASLRGITLYGQAWAQDPNANNLGVATTHAFEAVVGF